MHIYKYIHIQTYIYTHRALLNIYIYSMYIYIHIYVYIHIYCSYTYIHIYTQTELVSQLLFDRTLWRQSRLEPWTSVNSVRHILYCSSLSLPLSLTPSWCVWFLLAFHIVGNGRQFSPPADSQPGSSFFAIFQILACETEVEPEGVSRCTQVVHRWLNYQTTDHWGSRCPAPRSPPSWTVCCKTHLCLQPKLAWCDGKD